MNRTEYTSYGPYSSIIEKRVTTTDSNGNFSISMKKASNTSLSITKFKDDNYSEINSKSFEVNKDVIIKVHKFIKYKIYVNNTNPFDANDYFSIDFYSGNGNHFRTKIENFGVRNNYDPPSGSFGIYEYTSWQGTNVNSIVYYNVPENDVTHKIYWVKRKNIIETSGFTQQFQFQVNIINEFYFNY